MNTEEIEECFNQIHIRANFLDNEVKELELKMHEIGADLDYQKNRIDNVIIFINIILIVFIAFQLFYIFG